MDRVILNLGAGNRVIPGAVNHDLTKHRPEIDTTHDLNVLPWPWPDDYADEIQLVSVAEHLKLTLLETLDECWRILRPGGHLVIKYPVHTGPTIHDDPTHRWFWSAKALDFVDPTTRYGKVSGYYTERKWRIKSSGVVKGRNLKAIMEPIKDDD